MGNIFTLNLKSLNQMQKKNNEYKFVILSIIIVLLFNKTVNKEHSDLHNVIQVYT